MSDIIKIPPPESAFTIDDHAFSIDDYDKDSSNDKKLSDVFVIEELPEDYDPENQPSCHDQLPSVEEYKTSLPTNIQGQERSKKILNLTFAVLAVVTLIMSVIAIAKINHSSNNGTTTYTVMNGRTKEIEDFLFNNQVSTLPQLENPQSPQHKAAAFVADGDSYSMGMELNEENVKQFVERYVLAVLYYHFAGPEWTYNLKFLSGRDHCEWWDDFDTQSGKKIRQGVICDDDGYVIGLNLAWNNLKASQMPREIGYFGRLESIQMYNNDIGGTFPESFQYMTNLKSIGLMKTGMGGTLPSWIGQGDALLQLTTLGLGNNNFHGSIPESIKNLKNLKLLGLDNNNKLNGNMDLFKSMSKLQALYVQNNALSGSLLNFNWPNLMELDVSNNMLDDELPSALFNHPYLKVMDIHGNMFFGEFPTDVLKNEQLEFFAMQNNEIRGTIPDRLGFLSNLKHLDLSRNAFTGTIPDTLAQLTELRYWATSDNRFENQPLLDLSLMTNLKELSMKSNSLTGTIPEWIGQLSNIIMLDLDSNSLTGSIPSWIGVLGGKLEYLLLNRNQLTGTIPQQLENMHHLHAVFLNDNSFHGNANIICESGNNNNNNNNKISPEYFVSDCYPGENGESPEIECRCCTQCCRDNDPSCNNSRTTWESNHNTNGNRVDPIVEYGDIRKRYSFQLENAPIGYSKSTGDYEDILP